MMNYSEADAKVDECGFRILQESVSRYVYCEVLD